jgi:NADPH2:quinone reductase
MRIVQVRQFGPPEVLKVEEREEPQAEPGQVVIKVSVAGVAFGDTIVRAGKYPFPLPFVPGLQVGGQVIRVGPDGDQSLIGKLVVAHTNNNSGGYAEQVAVDANNVFPIPAGLSVEQAMGVFRAGQTATGLLKAMNVKAGESVLITAAAGSIGTMLIQLAKAASAGIVIGAARGKEKLAMASRLGADVAIDYSEDNWVEQVRDATGGQGVDVVLDAIGGTIGRQAFEALANGRGRLGIYGFSSGTYTQIETPQLTRRGLTVIGPLGIIFAMPASEQRSYAVSALAEAAAGQLTPIIGQTYPLERAAEAHAVLEARQTIGNVLLLP